MSIMGLQVGQLAQVRDWAAQQVIVQSQRLQFGQAAQVGDSASSWFPSS